jgi:hypothetical protein
MPRHVQQSFAVLLATASFVIAGLGSPAQAATHRASSISHPSAQVILRRSEAMTAKMGSFRFVELSRERSIPPTGKTNGSRSRSREAGIYSYQWPGSAMISGRESYTTGKSGFRGKFREWVADSQYCDVDPDSYSWGRLGIPGLLPHQRYAPFYLNFRFHGFESLFPPGEQPHLAGTGSFTVVPVWRIVVEPGNAEFSRFERFQAQLLIAKTTFEMLHETDSLTLYEPTGRSASLLRADVQYESVTIRDYGVFVPKITVPKWCSPSH